MQHAEGQAPVTPDGARRIGSTLVARSAGIRLASTATTIRNNAAPAMLTGSVGLTRYSRGASCGVAAREMASPAAIPNKASNKPCLMTIRSTPSWPGPQRHADTDFPGPLAHRVSHNSVKTYSGEQHGNDAEHSEEQRGEPRPEPGSRDVIRQGHRRQAGRVWIDGRHLAAEYGDETARIAVGPGIEGHPAFATSVVYLVKGHIKVWLRCFGQAVVLAVLHHSHNRERFAINLHPVPHRVASVEKAPREGFVDDHDARCVFVVLRPEIASGEKRYPQQVEVAGRHRGMMHIQVLAGPRRVPFDHNRRPISPARSRAESSRNKRRPSPLARRAGARGAAARTAAPQLGV